MSDNVVYLKDKSIKFIPHSVPVLCEIAGELLSEILILGEAKDGSIKMMTTCESVPDIVFYLETAKLAALGYGLEEEEPKE